MNLNSTEYKNKEQSFGRANLILTLCKFKKRGGINIKLKPNLKVIYLLVGNLLLLGLIKIFTLEPTTISGNGDPALLFIFIFIASAIWFGFHWIKTLIKRNLKLSTKTIISMLSISFFIYGIYFEKVKINNFLNTFNLFAAGKYIDPVQQANFIRASTSGLSIYTNTLYFNIVTFLMYIGFLNIIAIIAVFINQRVNNEDESGKKLN